MAAEAAGIRLDAVRDARRRETPNDSKHRDIGLTRFDVYKTA